MIPERIIFFSRGITVLGTHHILHVSRVRVNVTQDRGKWQTHATWPTANFSGNPLWVILGVKSGHLVQQEQLKRILLLAWLQLSKYTMGMCPAISFFMVSVDNTRWTEAEFCVFDISRGRASRTSVPGQNTWQSFSKSSPHLFRLVYCIMTLYLLAS